MNDWLARRVIGWAHRGGAGEAPANTVEAMRRALERGVHGLELDVRLTGDHEVVLVHDPVVAVRGTTLDVKSTSLAELRGIEPDLATLDEVLAQFPDAPMTVEIKAREAVGPTVRRLATVDRRGPVIVSSFSPPIVREVKRHGPSLDTAPAWPTILVVWLLSRVGVAAPVGRRHVALQVPLRLDSVSVVRRVPLVRRRRLCDRRFVRAAQRRGLAVHVWTLDDEAEIERALRAGVHGIMSDRPTALMRILRERGVSWQG